MISIPTKRVLVTALVGSVLCFAAPAGAERTAIGAGELPPPDVGRISQLYREARTIEDIARANDFVKGEVGKAGAMRSYLSKLHNTVAISCDAAKQLQRSMLDRMVEQTGSLQTTLSDIDARMSNSLAQQKKLAAGAQASYRSAQDLKLYEGKYAEFNIARVNAQEIAKSVDKVSANIRTAAEACTPATIPPLYETQEARAGGKPDPTPRAAVLPPQSLSQNGPPLPPSGVQSQPQVQAPPSRSRSYYYEPYYGYVRRYQ